MKKKVITLLSSDVYLRYIKEIEFSICCTLLFKKKTEKTLKSTLHTAGLFCCCLSLVMSYAPPKKCLMTYFIF